MGKTLGRLRSSKELTPEEEQAKVQKKVVKEHKKEVKQERKVQEAEDKKNQEAIIQGLIMGRVVWSGNLCEDYWFYLKQSHVILGIICCHRMHPYTRVERIVLFISLSLAGFGLSYMLLDSEGEMKETMTAQAVGIMVSITLIIAQIIMYQAALCKCVQEGSCIFNCCGQRAKAVGEWAGRCIVLIGMIFGACCFLFGVLIGMMKGVPLGTAIQAWVFSQVYSWVLSVFTGFLQFGFYWYGCWPCCCCNICSDYLGNGQAGQCLSGENAAHPKFCYPHGIEYPADMDTLWDADRCSTHRSYGRAPQQPGDRGKPVVGQMIGGQA